MPHVLALDIGSTYARAIVYDANATPLEGAAAKHKHDGADDPDELATLVGALAERARRAVTVDAVGVSCFWHSLVAVDDDGRPLTTILGWRDAGAAEDAKRLRERLDSADIHRRTGCPLHPSYWPAKLARLARTEPETFRRAARFLSFPDYLYARLVGSTGTSVSMASGTGLLDVRRGSWDEELVEALALEPERLPRIADEPAGEREPWYPALGDGACSNLGVGCVTRERAALAVGTSGAFRTVFTGEAGAVRPGLFRYRLDDDRHVEGGSLSDGGNLYFWLKRTLRDADEGELAARAPDAHGLTFLPLLGGERAPGWKVDARGAVAGLTFATTPLDLLQAALEGVAYRFAEIADLMPEVEAVVATGGAMAANDTWIQIVADVLARPVTASGVAEASARGAAVHALERLGLAAAPAPLGRTYEPRPDRAGVYGAARERQRRLYAAST